MWTSHLFCEPCWQDHSPGRIPFRIVSAPPDRAAPGVSELGPCCRCTRPTRSGIFVRERSDILRCHGVGPVHAADDTPPAEPSP